MGQQLTLREWRLLNGWTCEALAQVLEIPVETVIGWENNQVPVKPIVVYAIAYLYKIDADTIRI